MELHDAEILAKTLISKHCPEVHFEWSRTKTTYGDYTWMYQTKSKRIRLSSILTPYCTESEVYDTLMHEIAHALCAPGEGHGPLWRKQMRALGLDPYKSNKIEAEDSLNTLPGNWYGVCPKGHKSKKVFNRKPRKVRSCGICSPVYNEAYDLTWHKVE